MRFKNQCKKQPLRKKKYSEPSQQIENWAVQVEKENEGQKYNGHKNLGSWILPIRVFECFHIEFCRDFCAGAEQ